MPPYQSPSKKTPPPAPAMPAVGGDLFVPSFVSGKKPVKKVTPRSVVFKRTPTPTAPAAPSHPAQHAPKADNPIHKAILNPTASKAAAAHQVTREHGQVPSLGDANVWGNQIVKPFVASLNQYEGTNHQTARAVVKPSTAIRVVPHYQGEPSVNWQMRPRNPDGSWVKPGERPQDGAYMDRQPLYSDAYTASKSHGLSADEAALMLGPDTMANVQKANKIGSPILTGVAEAAATALPGVITARQYAQEGHVGLGTALSDVGNTALWLTGVGEVTGGAKAAALALRGGSVGQAFRDARVAMKAGKVARFDTIALARNSSRINYDNVLREAGVSRKGRRAMVMMHDHAAAAYAEREGVTQTEGLDRIYKEATYHAETATRGDMTGKHAFAQEGEQPEISNTLNTPADFIPLPDKNFLKNASRRLIRKHGSDVLPPGIKTHAQLEALLNELRARAIEASDFKTWYANSGNAILHYTQGDVQEADKIAALVAVYSPRAEVYSKKTEWNNLDRALNAYRDYHDSGQISPKWSISSHKTGEGDWQTFRAQQIMEGNFEWKGLKTNRFYRNFLQHIDDAKYKALFGDEKFGTMDTWMRRAFKYPKQFKTKIEETLLGPTEVTSGKAMEPISKQMYAFMEQANKIVGDSLGWSPEEVQAAIWTSIKAEGEGTSLGQAGFDFSDAFAHREARIAKPVNEQMALATELDQPRVDVAAKAVEVAKEPDGGFTLTVNLHPDASKVGWSASYGAYEQKTLAPLTKAQLLAYRDKHLALLKSDPTLRVGGWHNPDDGHIYLDISRVFPTHDEALAFGMEQGQLKIADLGKINRNEWDAQTFTATGLTPEEADAIKAAHKEQARLETQLARYDDLLLKAHTMWNGGKGPRTGVLSENQRREAEKYMSMWAQDNPGPLADQFNDLQYQGALARNSQSSHWLAQDDPLVQAIAESQGLKVDAQAAAEAHRGTDLAGLPDGRTSNKTAQQVARGYMEDAGLPYHPPTAYEPVDPERAKRIADWFDSAESAPNDPAVRASYDAMATETKAQYESITASGYRFEFYPAEDPYPVGPSQAIDDLRQNQHMYVYPTEAGFGTLSEAEKAHPLLVDSGVRWNGKVVTHNDLFRAVHDYMGHFKEGVGFRADGEENAWRAHVAMFSDEAKPAMTSETRGQNSWVNYGPHGDANQTAKQMETVYADQKAVLAPDWAIQEGSGAPRSVLADYLKVTNDSGANTPIKGAVQRFASGEHALHLFRGADITTAVHEFGHALETMIPQATRDALTAAGIHTEEDFARAFEAYFYEGHAPTAELAGAMRDIAVEMSKVYRSVDAIPGAQIGPEIRAQFDTFFKREAARDPSFAAKQGAAWLAQEDNTGGYTFHDVNDPNAKTFNHRGVEVPIASMNRGGDGEPFHINIHDPEGNLIGSQHGFDQAGEVHSTSVYIKPEHQGKGLSAKTHDMVRRYADSQGKPASAVFMNKDLGKREAARSLEQGRTTYSTREMKTYYQEGSPPPSDVPHDAIYGMSKEDMNQTVQAFMSEARHGRTSQAASDLEERAIRRARSEAAFRDPTEPDPRVRQANAEHESSGIMPIVNWQGHERLTPQVLTEMMNYIHESNIISTYKKMRSVRALSRIPTDRPPTESEFKLLEEIFGKMDGLRALSKEGPRWKKFVYELLNIPRSIMASFDMSAPLRQGLILGVQHPIIAGAAFKDMFRMFGSERFYQSFMLGLESEPHAELMLRAELAITDLEHAGGTAAGEEAFASNLAEKLFSFKPLTKNARTASPIRWSGRAYTGFLVKLRVDVFNHLIEEAINKGIAVDDSKFLMDLGNFINAATGRGQVLRKVEGSLDALNAAFFSPRLMASRMNFINILNPENYYRLDPFVRKQKILAAVETAGAVSGFLFLAAQIPGVSVGIDPRSANFAKIRMGNTRLDIAGGFQQYIRLFSELVTMTTVSSTTGEAQSLWSKKYGAKNGLDVALGFLEGKAAPIAAIGMDVLRGTDAIGNPITPWSEFKTHMIPLIGQDVTSIAHDPPIKGVNPVVAAFVGYFAGTFGTGLQTYKNTDPGDKPSMKLEQDAKDAGRPAPPQQILIDLKHRANLDSLSQKHPKDPKGRLKAYVKYAAEQGNKAFGSMLAHVNQMPDEQAKMYGDQIRTSLVGPGLAEYESSVKAVLQAKGK